MNAEKLRAASLTGTLELILGPMFAEKTSELQRRYRRCVLANQQCQMVKYAGDTRYTSDAQVVSHDGVRTEAHVCTQLGELKLPSDLNVLCIDEIQFFQDALEIIPQWLLKRPLKVIVAGLNGDYRQKPFPVMTGLLSLADKIDLYHAICLGCPHRNEATFTVRLLPQPAAAIDGKKKEEAKTNSQPDVGGREKYRAVCRACLLAETKDETAVPKV
jgi:thymidine kinase